MKELPKVYDPKKVEKKIYDLWMDGDYFHAKIDPDKKPFSIVMPPPSCISGMPSMPLCRISLHAINGCRAMLHSGFRVLTMQG